MSLHKYFHWAYYELGKRHVYNFGTAIFMWLFLLFTRPFGLYTRGFMHFLALGGLLLSVSSVFIISTYVVDIIASRAGKKGQKITLRLWVVKWLLFAHLIYFMRLYRCDWMCFDWLAYGEQLFAAMMLILFTYIPFALYGRAKYVARHSNNLSRVSIEGEGKERLLIDPDRLIYAKSDDNYVDFYIAEKNSKPQKQTLRCTLKSVEKQLSSIPQLRRIHRSYLINSSFKIQENNSTLKLQEGTWSKVFPISTKYRQV